jgi:hypothetical protein
MHIEPNSISDFAFFGYAWTSIRRCKVEVAAAFGEESESVKVECREIRDSRAKSVISVVAAIYLHAYPSCYRPFIPTPSDNEKCNGFVNEAEQKSVIASAFTRFTESYTKRYVCAKGRL